MKPQERTRAIMRSGLDTESKAVAVAICDYMAEEDLSWPSVATIAADASVGVRTAQRRIGEGIAAGWLQVHESRGRASSYSIVWEALPVRAPIVREFDPRRPALHPRQADTPVSLTPPSGGHHTPVSLTPPPPSAGRGKGPVEGTKEGTRREETPKAPVPGAAPVAPEAPMPEPAPPPEPESHGLPAWTPSAPACKPHPRADVAGMVVRSLEAIHQRPVNPERCGTDAKAILGLWRSLGQPPPADFEAEVALVAHAARECPARLFARDIRAEGWAEGTDRRSSPGTLTRRDRWTERLDAARAWEAQGFPLTEDRLRGTGPPRASPPPIATPTPADRRASILDALRNAKERSSAHQQSGVHRAQ